MGIRLSYQSAMPALAGFAAGRGRAKQRRRKYNLDLLQRQQELQMRYGPGSGYQSRLRGSQRGGTQGRWVIPDLETPTTAVPEGTPSDVYTAAEMTPIGEGAGGEYAGPEGKRLLRERRKANARARRLGKKAPFPGLVPKFVLGASEDEIKRRQELADRADERAYEEGQDSLAYKRKISAATMPDPPKWLEPGSKAYRRWMELNEAEGLLLGGDRTFDPEEHQEELAKIEQEREELLEANPKPSASGLMMDNIVYWDREQGRPFDEFAPGRVAMQMIDSKLMPIDDPVAEAENKAAEDQKAKDQKTASDIASRATKIRGTEIMKGGVGTGKFPSAEDAYSQAEEQVLQEQADEQRALERMQEKRQSETAPDAEGVPADIQYDISIPEDTGEAPYSPYDLDVSGFVTPTEPTTAEAAVEDADPAAAAEQRLEAAGFTVEDYVTANRWVKQIQQKYPNIKSEDELPEATRRQLKHAMKILNAGRGA